MIYLNGYMGSQSLKEFSEARSGSGLASDRLGRHGLCGQRHVVLDDLVRGAAR